MYRTIQKILYCNIISNCATSTVTQLWFHLRCISVADKILVYFITAFFTHPQTHIQTCDKGRVWTCTPAVSMVWIHLSLLTEGSLQIIAKLFRPITFILSRVFHDRSGLFHVTKPKSIGHSVSLHGLMTLNTMFIMAIAKVGRTFTSMALYLFSEVLNL